MNLTAEGCRQRQARLLERMSELGVSDAVLVNPKHVLYLTGYHTWRLHRSAVVLRKSGTCILVSAHADGALAADEHVPYQGQALSTLHLDQPQRVAQKISSILGRPPRLGSDTGETSAFLSPLAQELLDLEPVLIALRRRKDPDELEILRKGIEITQACYSRAREIIAPGISELEVYTELRKTAVLAAGEDLPVFGNDFQCGTPGGGPRPRQAQAGELYILDLGPEYAGYHADNCRTFAVDGSPTEEQQRAWRAIVEVLEHVESTVKPGISCKSLYEDARRRLDGHRPRAFFHHLGHGVGLSPHEMPNLNPHWDHFFEEGDFFTAEPGVYYPELRGGIRLEENYLVTARGVEKLTSFPLSLF